MAAQLTQEDFIKRAKAKHGDKFDYSQVKYIASHLPVKIVCPKHGLFEQPPNSHYKTNYACLNCAFDAQTLMIEKFIERSKIKHGDKYDYSKSIYINDTVKIEILCKEHGAFWKRPSDHFSGQGCPDCSQNARKKSLSEFIEEAREAHNGAYDYSKIVGFNGVYDDVEIVCPKHGSFFQTVHSHLSGAGCRLCGFGFRTTDEFVAELKEIFGPIKYDFSQVVFENQRTKVKMVCHSHGEWLAFPYNLLKGRGCRKCKSHVSTLEQLWLTALGVPNTKETRQVSIWTADEQRFFVDGFNPITKTVYEFNGDFYHGNPSFYDADELNVIAKQTFGFLYSKTQHKLRTLELEGYEVISVWESDFVKQVCEIGPENSINWAADLPSTWLRRIRDSNRIYTRLAEKN